MSLRRFLVRHVKLKNIFICCTLFVLACLPSWVTVAGDPNTPFDEFAHFDYADRIANLEMPRVNDPYSQRSLTMFSCLPELGDPWLALRPCTSKFVDPTRAPFQGQSYSTPNTPTYYATVAIPYRVCTLLTPRESPMQPLRCMRTSNSLFAGGSAIFIYLTILEFSRRRWSAFVAAAISVNSPAMIQQFSTVNSDSGAFFAVAIISYLAVRLTRKTASRAQNDIEINPISLVYQWKLILTFIALGTFALSMKETSIIIVPFAVSLFVLRLQPASPGSISRRYLIKHLLPMGTFILFALGLMTALVRITQTWVRGTGGNDYMNDFLKKGQQLSTNVLLTPIEHLFNSGSQITWDPLADPFGRNLSLVMGTLFMASLLASRTTTVSNLRIDKNSAAKIIDDIPRIHDVSLKQDAVIAVQRLSFVRALTIGGFLLPLSAFILGILSQLQAGLLVSQPRYYLPATSLIGGYIIFLLLESCKKSTVTATLLIFGTLIAVVLAF